MLKNWFKLIFSPLAIFKNIIAETRFQYKYFLFITKSVAKIKYFYNPNKLDFEKVRTSFTTVIWRVFGFLSASLVSGAIMVLALYSFIDSPKEKILQRENRQYKDQLRRLQTRVSELSMVLGELQDRDAQIYRTIFEADPISFKPKFNPNDRKYKLAEGFDDAEVINDLNHKVENITSLVAMQSKSFDELKKLADSKQEFLASIPAIQPIANKDLKRIASGFGYRIHPIYKTTKFHSGIDFTAPTRTPVYATGNGIISFAKYEGRGYGNHIVINHGFGYKSLYGHLSSIEVYERQKVKRGELIGYVGNTGTSTAPHLHYEVEKGTKKVNPINYFFNDISEADYEAIRDISARPTQSFD
jgi:murein DD-endopeptidase MepM/ murein hydrolase activator NlpD